MTVLSPMTPSQREWSEEQKILLSPSSLLYPAFIKIWGHLRPGTVRGERDQSWVKLLVHVQTGTYVSTRVTQTSIHKNYMPCHRALRVRLCVCTLTQQQILSPSYRHIGSARLLQECGNVRKDICKCFCSC